MNQFAREKLIKGRPEGMKEDKLLSRGLSQQIGGWGGGTESGQSLAVNLPCFIPAGTDFLVRNGATRGQNIT